MKEIVLLMGPPAAGKSYYCKTALPGHFRVNGDEMGSAGWKKSLKDAAKDGIDKIVVDRMNFNREQRSLSIGVARANGYSVRIVEFKANPEHTLYRAAYRKEHPTIKDGLGAISATRTYFGLYEAPQPEEYDEYTWLDEWSTEKLGWFSPLKLRIDAVGDYKDMRDLKGKVLVVGDVHGCLDQLHALIAKAAPDHIVLAGDLTDRGSQNLEVLRFAMQTPNVHVIRGNHCDKMIRWLGGAQVRISHGNQVTIDELESIDVIERQLILGWWKERPLAILLKEDSTNYFVCHAGIDPRLPIYLQSKETMIYVRYLGGKNFIEPTGGGKLWWDMPWHESWNDWNIIHGHIVTEEIRPNPRVWSIDGGCCGGGKLRGVLLNV